MLADVAFRIYNILQDAAPNDAEMVNEMYAKACRSNLDIMGEMLDLVEEGVLNHSRDFFFISIVLAAYGGFALSPPHMEIVALCKNTVVVEGSTAYSSDVW